jgi:hypothetical protein
MDYDPEIMGYGDSAGGSLEWQRGPDGTMWALWFGPPPWWKFWTREWDWVWLRRERGSGE